MTPQPLSHEDLLLLVDDLLELEVLELIPSQIDSTTMYIPYMMNDAVEYYIILYNYQIMGTVPYEFSGDTLVKLVDTPDRPGLIFDMPSGEKLTLWFDRCESVRNFYQYHRLGHFWRKGDEHWRMLVYMIGTIHDKYAFLGPDSVNDEELFLLPLVHFGPFRYYSPIDEPLDDRYPESDDGWDCMRHLALSAGDTDYVKKIDRANIFKKLPLVRSDTIITNLANALTKPERRTLFEYIYRKVCEASARYPERTYDADTFAEIENARRKAAGILSAKGFLGEYPLYYKGETSVLILEEHPFTVRELDYDGFSFRIHAMIWSSNEKCPHIRTLREINTQ